MKKAIIYLGDFAYDLGNVFARAVGQAMSAAGLETVYFDLRDPQQCHAARNRRLYRDAELVFAVNAIRPSADEDDFRFFRDTGCVFIAMLIDPPLLQYPRLFFNNDILTCIDRSHIRLIDRYLRLPSRCCFLPHGGSPGGGTPLPWERRGYELIFAGTWSDPDAAWAQITELPDNLRRIFSEAAERLVAAATCDPFLALEETLLDYGIDPAADPDIFNHLIVHYRRLDTFIRARQRLAALDALDRAGIKTEIWGNGWPVDRFKTHLIHPPRPLEEINRLMGRSRLVLDLGMYPDGSHERVFTAMLNGAAALAVDNPWHRENFRSGENMILYRNSELDRLPEIVAANLADEERLARIADAGQTAAQQHHSWTVRAQQLLALAGEYRRHATSQN